MWGIWRRVLMTTTSAAGHQIRARTAYLLWREDYEPVALLLALAALGRGLWILSPWTDTFEHIPLYHLHLHMAPEWLWGAIYAGMGGAHLIAVLGCWPRLIRHVSYATGIIWAISASLYVYDDVTSPAGVLFATLSLGALWVYVRSGLDDV